MECNSLVVLYSTCKTKLNTGAIALQAPGVTDENLKAADGKEDIEARPKYLCRKVSIS